VNHRLAVVLLFVGVLGLVAACSQATIGSGIPTTTGSGQPNSSGAGTTSSGAGSSLKSIQPCSLLSAAVVSQYQLAQSDTIPGTGGRPCNWQNTTDASGIGYVVDLTVRDSQGTKDFNSEGNTVTSENVGRHQGLQAITNAGGGCDVTIGVTDSSRVDIEVVAGTDTNHACDLANQLAKLVEPQLP
jgi:hypothetical protein